MQNLLLPMKLETEDTKCQATSWQIMIYERNFRSEERARISVIQNILK